jgi:hypothetical protein
VVGPDAGAALPDDEGVDVDVDDFDELQAPRSEATSRAPAVAARMRLVRSRLINALLWLATGVRALS